MISAGLSPMPLSVTVRTSRTRPRVARAARTSSRTPPRSVNFTALSMRFSSAARSRTASPTKSSGTSSAMLMSAARPLASARAASEFGEAFNQMPRPESFRCSRSAPASALAASIIKRRERGEMLGAAFDAGSPAPLAFAEIGAGQQFAERQDAGERRADVVGVGRQRSFRLREPAARAAASGAAPVWRPAFWTSFAPIFSLAMTAPRSMPWRRQERNEFNVQLFSLQGRPCA